MLGFRKAELVNFILNYLSCINIQILQQDVSQYIALASILHELDLVTARLELLALCLGHVVLLSEVGVELPLEFVLQINCGLLAHHFYLAGDALVQHVLPLLGLSGKRFIFTDLPYFAIWWLIYFPTWRVICSGICGCLILLVFRSRQARELILDV